MSDLADQAGGGRLFPSNDYMRGWKAASDAAQKRIVEMETALRELRGAALPIVDDGNTLQSTLDNLDKACCRAQDVLYLRGVETGSAIESPREMSSLSHDAMKECVAALKRFVDVMGNRKPEDMLIVLADEWNDAISALSKLEKANG